MEHIKQYHIKFETNHTILNNVHVKRLSSCCFRGHNLHVGVTALRTLSVISFFPSNNFFYFFF